MFKALLPDFKAASRVCCVGPEPVVFGLDSELPLDEVGGLSGNGYGGYRPGGNWRGLGTTGLVVDVGL